MIRRTTLALVALGLLVGVADAATPTRVRLATLDGAIHIASAYRIEKAIEEAAASGDDLVLIEMDTPGGLSDTTNDLVQSILNSEVPVVVWVGPSGAQAASAGLFVLLAADVALMAPGTRTGASSTIVMGGENRPDDVLLKKANEDAAALLRSVATRRGRNAEAAERAVFEATAYEEQRALELKLIDGIAADRAAVLAFLDGREVRRFDESVATLTTGDVVFVETEFSWLEDVRMILALPAVAAILLLGGLAGLWIELTQPGVVLPGVVGVLCLILFAFSAAILPVSAVGLLLIALAIVMFVLEIKVTSFGMLTLGGAVCLVFGGILLIDGPIPALRVPPAVVVPVALAIVALVALAMRLVLAAHRERIHTGVEAMVGAAGVARGTVAPGAGKATGQVWVQGALWGAVARGEAIPSDAPVRVVEVDGMLLTVERRPEEGP